VGPGGGVARGKGDAARGGVAGGEARAGREGTERVPWTRLSLCQEESVFFMLHGYFKGVMYLYPILVGYVDTDTRIHHFSGFFF